MTCLYAQDDLEALLKDLGGKQKPAAAAPAVAAPAVAKPVEAAPAVVEKPAEAVPAAVPTVAAPVAAEKPAVAPAVAAPAAAVPAAVPTVAAPVVAEKPAAAAPAVATPVAEKPAAAPVAVVQDTGDTGSLVSELLTLETLRRKSLDDHGYASLETARKALHDGDYVLARDQYKQALDFIGNRPDTVAAREEASAGIGEAFYRDAKLAMKKGDYDKALPLASQALERGHPQAGRLIETLKKEPAKNAADVTSISHRINDADYKEQREEIRHLLRRSRQYFTTAEYDKALESCELVLRDYPFNTEAMELRDRIADRMKDVADVEFEATRSLMIKDVRKTWTPERYAIESSQLPKGKGDVTSKQKVAQISGTKTSEQLVQQKLKEIVIPEVTFRPPATIIDAVDFFKQASRDYDKPEIPVEQRGVNLVLKLSSNAAAAAPAAEAAPAAAADPFAAPAAAGNAGGAPQISALSARFISLYDALKLVCDVTGMKFRIRGNIVMIVPANDPESELVTRSYNVLATLSERVTSAQSELEKNPAGAGGENTFMATKSMDAKQDWKVFFQQMGVVWPDGSSISYMATIGKLRVTNTSEQLAVFEQVLEDLNVTPRLIEIEARFVEVSQKDLNSLGFEWLLNSDLSFDAGGVLSKALNLQNYGAKNVSAAPKMYWDPSSNTMRPVTDANGNPVLNDAGRVLSNYTAPTANAFIPVQHVNPSDPTSAIVPGTGIYSGLPGYQNAPNQNAMVNAVDGNTYSTGNRYLSTLDNPISGKGNSSNDKFMRINAFLGNADLSMILHMLSQRSDTDLLSAPKVVTKSGQEAVMKVVTEYIYPTEFQVTISQQSSGGSLTGGGSGEPLAMVEPQNFEMREVGVILQVVPEVSAEGQMINLMLNPQVVSEPVWKDYGTKIPKGNTPSVFDAITKQFITGPTIYQELPMPQPFFSVRSVQTQLSIYNGATVVMGGLITEARTTIEDKIPFLGDLPYIGRLFRSRSEQSDKRNLLVFVTARLVDPAGRAVRTSGGESALMSGSGTPGAVSGQTRAQTAAPEAAPEAPAK